jgi:biotin---protein ligase
MSYLFGSYAGEGVGNFSSTCLAEVLSASGRVQLIDAQSMAGGYGLDRLDFFVMPGGADIPYGRSLNGAGNACIRRYVEQGGIYLGFCAGAYYGCADISFMAGSAQEISGL